MKINPIVYQVLVWGQDVRDADFDVTMNYATTPHPVATTLLFAEVIARDAINQARVDEGHQLIFITITDFTFRVGKTGAGVWTYTEGDTGVTVEIHETEVKNA